MAVVSSHTLPKVPPAASAAFSRTLRAALDWRGQMITMLDHCYLAEPIPVQIIWGEQDSVIPVGHARLTHKAIPCSQLALFDHCGHFPFHDDPDRFIEVVGRFIDSTNAAVYDQELLRRLLRAGLREDNTSGPRNRIDPRGDARIPLGILTGSTNDVAITLSDHGPKPVAAQRTIDKYPSTSFARQVPRSYVRGMHNRRH
jgi:hypothetical protein